MIASGTITNDMISYVIALSAALSAPLTSDLSATRAGFNAYSILRTLYSNGIAACWSTRAIDHVAPSCTLTPYSLATDVMTTLYTLNSCATRTTTVLYQAASR